MDLRARVQQFADQVASLQLAYAKAVSEPDGEA